MNYKIFKYKDGSIFKTTRLGNKYLYQDYLRDIYYPYKQRKNRYKYFLYINFDQWIIKPMKTNIKYKENRNA